MINELKIFLFNHPSENPKVLDLGCGLPSEIFCWFKELKIKNNKYFSYVGVDIEEEINILYWPNINGVAKYEITENDWINKINNEVCIEIEEETDFRIDINLFQEYFRLYFNTDIIGFIKSLPTNYKYDIIILSNILDKLNKADADLIFNKCLSLISNDGFIYVSVLGNKYEEKKEEDNLYSYQEYIEMKQKVKVLWNSEDARYNFQFIGTKF